MTMTDKAEKHPEKCNSLMPYYCALQLLHRKGKHLLTSEWSSKAGVPSMKILRECAVLSEWMYDRSQIGETMHGTIGRQSMALSDYKSLLVRKDRNRAEGKSQWKFLHSKSLHTAYLIFRGTDPSNASDLITDFNFLPTPIYPTEYPQYLHREDAELSAHGGIERAVAAFYEIIKMQIAYYVDSDDVHSLYITGHSLGGGMAIVFGLKALVEGFFPMKNVKVQIIVFAAPSVVARERKYRKLSKTARRYWDRLSAMTHCFVNRWDVAPRLMSLIGNKWYNFLTTQFYRSQKARNLVTNNVALCACLQRELQKLGVFPPSRRHSRADTQNAKTVEDMLCGLIGNEGDCGQRYSNEADLNLPAHRLGKWQRIKKQVQLFPPLGTYYVFTVYSAGWMVTDKEREIKELLSFIPPPLSADAHTLKMLTKDHNMKRYLEVIRSQFVDDSFVLEYSDSVRSAVLNGKLCTADPPDYGFWIKVRVKRTPIGRVVMEKRSMEAIREVMWSRKEGNGLVDLFEIKCDDDGNPIEMVIRKSLCDVDRDGEGITVTYNELKEISLRWGTLSETKFHQEFARNVTTQCDQFQTICLKQKEHSRRRTESSRCSQCEWRVTLKIKKQTKLIQLATGVSLERMNAIFDRF